MSKNVEKRVTEKLKKKRKIGGIFSSTAQRNIYKMLQKSFAATNSRV